MIDKQFILGGRAVFTMQIPDTFRSSHPEVKDHYTWKVTHKPASGGYHENWFCSLLVAPDLYMYQGWLHADTGVFVRGKKALPENCYAIRLFVRMLKAMWDGRTNEIEAAGFKLHHEGRCCFCGRALTTPESTTRGYGPECADKRGLPYGESRDVVVTVPAEELTETCDVADQSMCVCDSNLEFHNS